MDMKFNFTKLDSKTRELMVEEIRRAEQSGELYFSARFNAAGNHGWVGWLTSAAE